MCAHAGDERATGVQDLQAEWDALEASVGKDDGARREAWEWLEDAATATELHAREAIRVEADKHGLEADDVQVQPEGLLCWNLPPEQTWKNDASRAATERAFGDYMRERLYGAADRVRGFGDMCVPAGGQPFLELRLDWAIHLRRYASWEWLRMGRLLEEGRGVQAAVPFENDLALGIAALRTPMFIGRLMGSAIAQQPFWSVKEWIASHGMDEATAMAFGRALDRQRAAVPPISFTLEGERLWALGTIDLAFANDGVDPPDPRVDPNVAAMVAKGAEREPNAEAIDAFYSALQEWAAKPVRTRRAMDDTLKQMKARMEKKAPLAAYMLGASQRGVRASDHTRCSFDGMRLMLALEAYKARHGAYPQALAALAPEFIDAVPDDPFAPDGAWRYRLVEAGEVSREAPGVKMGYVLYSVGYDGKDNGGRETGSLPKALYPGAAGTDFVVNAVGE